MKKDKYGRSIGKVSTEKVKDVNLEIINAGYAWHYKEYNKDKSYTSAENNARVRKLGLWQDRSPIKPQNFRKKRSNNDRVDKNFSTRKSGYET